MYFNPFIIKQVPIHVYTKTESVIIPNAYILTYITCWAFHKCFVDNATSWQTADKIFTDLWLNKR